MPAAWQRSTKQRERLGRAQAGGGGELAERLVAPGAAERMLHDRQQLDMGEAEPGGIRHELVGQPVPAVHAHAGGRRPGPGVHLVDRDRRALGLLGRPVRDPLRIGPGERQVVGHDRGGQRRDLVGPGDRVRLERQQLAGRPRHLVFVEHARADAGDEQLPHARPVALAHRVAASVPAVEVAHDGDALRVRRPDGEAHAGHALHLRRVRAQGVAEIEVAALGEQVDVQIAEHGRERVRVLGLVARGALADTQAIGPLRADGAGEEARRVNALQLAGNEPGVAVHDGDGVGAGDEGADGPVMRAEHGEGVAVARVDDGVDGARVQSEIVEGVRHGRLR